MNLLEQIEPPKKWYIPVTEENQAELNKWWRMKAVKSGWIHKEDKDEESLNRSFLLLSEHPHDNSYYYCSGEDLFRLTYTSYKKITLDQFRQIKKTQTLNHEPT
jgi:hypothetical protein